jgi:CheY-like chemotaxis protein
VQVFLPRAQETSRPAAYSESAVASEGPGLGRTVLVVDDDNSVREVTSAALQELGYEVVEADGGNAALAILRQMPIDALVLDYAMPEMNGIDTAAAARAICPEVPIIFVTGYADLAAVKDVGERYVVQKPFRNEDLAAKLVFAMKEQVTGTGRVIPFAKRRDGGESRSAGGSP